MPHFTKVSRGTLRPIGGLPREAPPLGGAKCGDGGL